MVPVEPRLTCEHSSTRFCSGPTGAYNQLQVLAAGVSALKPFVQLRSFAAIDPMQRGVMSKAS